jgi:magnesium-transporting ATPase (P-type)
MASGSAAWWVLSSEQVVQQLQTDLQTGLDTGEVQKRRQQHGYNELQKEPGKPMWRLILEQFDDMLVKVVACWGVCGHSTARRADACVVWIAVVVGAARRLGGWCRPRALQCLLPDCCLVAWNPA